MLRGLILLGLILLGLIATATSTTTNTGNDDDEMVVPDTMRAVVATGTTTPGGSWSTIQLQTSAKVPSPGIGQVLIRVHASSVNPVDWKIVESGSGLPFGFPHTLGFDVSGVVAKVGVGCSRLKVGDEVWADLGKTWLLHGGELGAYADYALADESQVGLKPTNLTHAEAGSLPLAALTTFQAFRKTGAPHAPGSPWGNSDGNGNGNTTTSSATNLTVLVTSGSGGTGVVALQLARAYGARSVVTACDAAHLDFCKAHGATQVVDFRVASALDSVPDDSVDVVYDNYGAKNTADKAMAKLRAGGVFILLPGKGGALAKKLKPGVKQINFGLCDSSSHEDLDALAVLVSQGHLRATVQQSFPLEQVREAFNVSYQGNVVGKLGIQVVVNEQEEEEEGARRVVVAQGKVKGAPSSSSSAAAANVVTPAPPTANNTVLRWPAGTTTTIVVPRTAAKGLHLAKFSSSLGDSSVIDPSSVVVFSNASTAFLTPYGRAAGTTTLDLKLTYGSNAAAVDVHLHFGLDVV